MIERVKSEERNICMEKEMAATQVEPQPLTPVETKRTSFHRGLLGSVLGFVRTDIVSRNNSYSLILLNRPLALIPIGDALRRAKAAYQTQR